jgi:hypothetical protein
VKKYETEQDRRVATIHRWVEAGRRMKQPLGNRHLARSDKGRWTRK